MKKVFVVICRGAEAEYLSIEKETLFFSTMYEHTYRKYADAIKHLKMDAELVRSASFTLEGVSSEINCNLEDIIIFTHPLAFLAERREIEEAIRFVDSNDLAYATVGSPISFYATIGTGKLLSEETVASPYDFITMIENCGANCEVKAFGKEKAMPDSRAEYIRRCERYRTEFLDYLCENGVRIDLRDCVMISPCSTVGEGTVILPNTQIVSGSQIGKDCMIGPNSIVSGSIVGDSCVVDSSQVYASTIEKEVEIGPYCNLSDSCHLLTGSRVYGYSKLKSSTIGVSSTVNDHSIIADTEIGKRVTVGASVITINYDGKKISECKILDDAFIGAGVNLVAPLTVGAGAYVAAGSTITDDVPTGSLAVAREYQSNHDNWAKRRKL